MKIKILKETYDYVNKHRLTIESLNTVDSLIDEDYPQSWKIDEFKALDSFKTRVEYCNQHLQKIASGSSRIAYKIDEEKVLKLAKNRKGLAQNEVEIGASHDSYFSNIFAKVFDYDANDLWLEMELARKVTKSNFNKITGISFEDYSNVLRQFVEDNKGGRNKAMRMQFTSDMDENTLEKVYENELYMSMTEYIMTYDIPFGDLIRTNSYGIVKRSYGDDIVLIDYGLTSEVYDSYYS